MSLVITNPIMYGILNANINQVVAMPLYEIFPTNLSMTGNQINYLLASEVFCPRCHWWNNNWDTRNMCVASWPSVSRHLIPASSWASVSRYQYPESSWPCFSRYLIPASSWPIVSRNPFIFLSCPWFLHRYMFPASSGPCDSRYQIPALC